MPSSTPRETPPQLLSRPGTLMERTIVLTEGTDAFSRNLYWPAETWRRRIVSDFTNHSVWVGVTQEPVAHC
jgi:hypothetical protein